MHCVAGESAPVYLDTVDLLTPIVALWDSACCPDRQNWRGINPVFVPGGVALVSSPGCNGNGYDVSTWSQA